MTSGVWQATAPRRGGRRGLQPPPGGSARRRSAALAARPSTSTGPGARRRARAGRRGRRRRRRAGRSAPPRAARCPSASCAASVAACVQPEPCAAPCGMPLAGDRDDRVAAGEEIRRLLAVPAGERRRTAGPSAWTASASSGRPSSSPRAGQHARLRDVRRDDRRPRQDQLAQRGLRASARAAAHRTPRPSRGRRRSACRARAGRARRLTASALAALPSMPIFTASTPRSLDHGADLRDDHVGRDRLDGRDLDGVLGGDRGDRAWCRARRSAANAFRSAWIPAPPPESEPAIVRHTGIWRAGGIGSSG